MNSQDNMPRGSASPDISSSEIVSGETNPKKYSYKRYTAKEKWLFCLLISLFTPFSLFFFGPFEIYGNNMDEFKFVLSDFWAACGIIALLCSALIFGLLMLLRGRAFDVGFGLVFGISFMFFIQGNYLSLGSASLSGDGVGDEVSTVSMIINLLIWIIVVSACVVAMLLLNRYKEIIRAAVTVAAVALLGMTLISFAVISMTTDVYSDVKTGYQGDPSLDNEVLTVKNLDTLATENNIVVFIVDRFDHTYMDKALEDCPEIFDELDGFTHFNDYISLYPRTYPGVPHIVTGVENDFSGSRHDYMKKAYSESPYFMALKEKDFDINVYTDDYYGYVNATHMRDFVSNTSGNVSYSVVGKNSLSLDMIRVSLYRYLPLIAREALGTVNTPMFDKYVAYDLEDAEFSTDMKEVYDVISKDEFTFRKSKNGISYIHISGCHLPNLYGPDFEAAESDERYDSNVAMKVSFEIISTYIKEMKRMGVYENATIIILGDHCNIGSDRDFPKKPHVTTLIAKPAGIFEGEMKHSDAQVGARDVLATVLEAAESDKAAAFGQSIFDIPEGEDRSRPYHFQLVVGTLYEGTYINGIFEVVGPGDDLDNWHLKQEVELGKNIYD